MTVLEIVLLIAGVLCVAVSFLVKDESSGNFNAGDEMSRELTEQDKEHIRKQIDEILEERISDVSEKTEAQLDKISNTKILEMNDYAETIMGEINRNHNETVFLYDMLNEKAKEVKSTVKDVNIAKREVAKIQYESTIAMEEQDGQRSSAAESSSSKPERSKQQISAYNKGNLTGAQANGIIESGAKLQQASKTNMASGRGENSGHFRSNNSKDLAKERLIELVRKSTENSKELQRTAQIKVEPLKAAEAIKTDMAAQTTKKETDSEKKASAANAEPVKSEKEAETTIDEIKKAAPEEVEQTEAKKAAPKKKVEKAKPVEQAKKETASKAAETDRETASKPAEKETVSKAAEADKETASKPKTTRKKTVKKTAEAEDTEKQPEDINVSIQFDKSVNKNEAIIDMYKQGISNKEIAKQLNLGIGEVKLVVDLFKNTK